jgi:hypothetical protein
VNLDNGFFGQKPLEHGTAIAGEAGTNIINHPVTL